jgi:hypothetical protein
VEQLGAGSRAEGVEALPEHLLKLWNRQHARTLTDPGDPSHNIECDHRQMVLWVTIRPAD